MATNLVLESVADTLLGDVLGDGIVFELAAGAQGLAGAAGPNTVSDATTVGTLTAVTDAASLLTTNAAGNAVRRIGLSEDVRNLLGATNAAGVRSAIGLAGLRSDSEEVTSFGSDQSLSCITTPGGTGTTLIAHDQPDTGGSFSVYSRLARTNLSVLVAESYGFTAHAGGSTEVGLECEDFQGPSAPGGRSRLYMVGPSDVLAELVLSGNSDEGNEQLQLNYTRGLGTNFIRLAWPQWSTVSGQHTITVPQASGSMLLSSSELNASNLTSGTVPAARLPIASAGSLGGVRVGSGLSIDGSGVLSASGGGAVASVFGRTGVVTAQTGDYSASQISGLGSLATLNAAPAGTLTGTTLASGVTASSLTSLGTLTGLAVGGISRLFAASGNVVEISNTISGRAATLFYNDPAGQLRFGRTDHTNAATVQVNSSEVIWGSTGNQFVFQLSLGNMAFTPREAGGTGLIQFGRRITDNSTAVGAEVQCWPTTTQTTPALAIMAPGGGSYRAEWRPDGSIRLASLSDAAAANNTVYFSTTANRLVYKDSSGTVNNLY